MDREKKRVVCPVCGYRMPISYTEDAKCDGVYVPCKGRYCNHLIEVKIKKGQQIK